MLSISDLPTQAFDKNHFALLCDGVFLWLVQRQEQEKTFLHTWFPNPIGAHEVLQCKLFASCVSGCDAPTTVDTNGAWSLLELPYTVSSNNYVAATTWDASGPVIGITNNHVDVRGTASIVATTTCIPASYDLNMRLSGVLNAHGRREGCMVLDARLRLDSDNLYARTVWGFRLSTPPLPHLNSTRAYLDVPIFIRYRDKRLFVATDVNEHLASMELPEMGCYSLTISLAQEREANCVISDAMPASHLAISELYVRRQLVGTYVSEWRWTYAAPELTFYAPCESCVLDANSELKVEFEYVDLNRLPVNANAVLLLPFQDKRIVLAEDLSLDILPNCIDVNGKPAKRCVLTFSPISRDINYARLELKLTTPYHSNTFTSQAFSLDARPPVLFSVQRCAVPNLNSPYVNTPAVTLCLNVHDVSLYHLTPYYSCNGRMWKEMKVKFVSQQMLVTDVNLTDAQAGCTAGDGPKAVSVRVTDSFGRLSMVRTLQLTLDRTPPAAPSITLLRDENTHLRFSVNTAYDNYGLCCYVVHVTRSYAGTIYKESHKIPKDANVFELSFDGEGFYVIVLQAIDLAYNDANSIPIHFLIDKTPPNFLTYFPEERVEYGKLTLMLFDTVGVDANTVALHTSHSVIYPSTCKADQNGVMYCVFDVDVLGEGVHSLRARFSDLAGNYATGDLNIIVDRPPEVNCLMDGNVLSVPKLRIGFYDAWPGIDMNSIKFNSPTAAFMGVDCNSTVSDPYVCTILLDVNEGLHTFRVSATTHSNQRVDVNCTIVFDFTPPSIKVFTPKEGITYSSQQIMLTFTADDELTGVDKLTYILDGDERTVDGNTLLTLSACGGHLLVLTAYDVAGNKASHTVQFFTTCAAISASTTHHGAVVNSVRPSISPASSTLFQLTPQSVDAQTKAPTDTSLDVNTALPQDFNLSELISTKQSLPSYDILPQCTIVTLLGPEEFEVHEVRFNGRFYDAEQMRNVIVVKGISCKDIGLKPSALEIVGTDLTLFPISVRDGMLVSYLTNIKLPQLGTKRSALASTMLQITSTPKMLIQNTRITAPSSPENSFNKIAISGFVVVAALIILLRFGKRFI
jgi:hypothetical protein